MFLHTAVHTGDYAILKDAVENTHLEVKTFVRTGVDPLNARFE